MFKRKLLRQLLFAALLALLLTCVVDLKIGLEGGFSYLFSLLGEENSQQHGWIGLRDGLVGNLAFFLCAGIVVSLATWNDPQSQPFVHRLMAMFPHLHRHTEWIAPIVSLVKEDASITISATVTVTFEDYDASARAYRISVSKEETIFSLLDNEPYEDGDFQIRVSADRVSGYPILGVVTEAKMTPTVSPVSRSGVVPQAQSSVDFLDGEPKDLTPEKLDWGVEDKTVQLAVGMDGLLSLKYWVYASVNEPFISVIRRPAREIKVILKSKLPQSAAVVDMIPVRLYIKGEQDRRHVFVRNLKPGRDRVEVSFSPRRRRPVLRLDFGVPGAILDPDVSS